jgi:atlastin
MAAEQGHTPPHPIQIVKANEKNHTFSLEKDALKRLLSRDDVSDKKVVIVSVAGAFRTGKSFLLNFMLRYLTASNSLKPEVILTDRCPK